MLKTKVFSVGLRSASLIVFIASLLASCGGKKADTVIPEAVVSHGTFLVDIYEEGEVEALNSIHITARFPGASAD